ncbi:2Fe-2S iron-sulfur cluster-binding protein [Halomonas faecis]|uniref:2Fe-2S iron-sulfur cluster-binding protein n=1 Tax=Halomonas faecis TaxID=1562110 RepID=UPI0013D27F24
MDNFIGVDVDGERLELPNGSSFLRLAVDNPGAIPFRCKQGICGSCRIQIIEGGENASSPSKEESDFLMRLGHDTDNTRLACQTHAYGSLRVRTCNQYKGGKR